MGITTVSWTAASPLWASEPSSMSCVPVSDPEDPHHSSSSSQLLCVWNPLGSGDKFVEKPEFLTPLAVQMGAGVLGPWLPLESLPFSILEAPSPWERSTWT